jgi:tRNA threonylcarbamoyladenosine biosynthesis protein TsaB
MTGTVYKNILAIDTSTRCLKLALSYGADRLVKSQEEVEKSHGQFIVKKIDELFQSSGLKADQLDAIAVCTGPGSFTGLRIGLAVAKGMAVALSIPIAGVNLFAVAAHKLRDVEGKVHVIIPLNRDECFTAIIENRLYDEQSLSIVPYANLVSKVGHHRVAGIGINLSRQFPQLQQADVSSYLDYDGADLLYLGRRKLSDGQQDDLAQLEPVYIQKTQAELRFEQRRLQP